MTKQMHYRRLDLSQSLPPMPAEWGFWRLDPELLVLRLDNGDYRYEVDLEKFDSSAGMLDMIMQLTSKGSVSTMDIGCLVRALNDLFHPQGSLCSFGTDKRIGDVGEFLRERVS
jgi:hypothetical protein